MAIKDKIINYIITTPHNTNPAVLSSMLDSLSDGESGGGSNRVLLYENDTLDISTSGASPIKYITLQQPGEPPYGITNDTYTLEIDGTVVLTGVFIKKNDYYYLGLTSPGDTAGLADYSAGVRAMTVGGAGNYIVIGVYDIYIDSSKFDEDTHSVKIYKEITA